MKTSVIIPVYNEQDTVARLLDKVCALPLEKELIIVDDGSTDNTAIILKTYEGRANVRIIYQGRNQGKGSAIRTGLPWVTGEIVAIQDADLEYEPADILRLIGPIVAGQTQIVYGSRYQDPGNLRNINPFFRTGVTMLSWLTGVLYRQQITDVATCYKVFRIDVLRQIELEYDRFEFCAEVTAKASNLGYTIMELPISYSPRAAHQGKKIKWQDGVKALWVLIAYKKKF